MGKLSEVGKVLFVQDLFFKSGEIDEYLGYVRFLRVPNGVEPEIVLRERVEGELTVTSLLISLHWVNDSDFVFMVQTDEGVFIAFELTVDMDLTDNQVFYRS